jgi:hypothetical protein
VTKLARPSLWKSSNICRYWALGDREWLPMEKLSKRRMHLLLELENIIGNECYNANIQNWGPNGVFEGEGREFRYPITFIYSHGHKVKTKTPDPTTPVEVAVTGFYAFGANQLQIIRALDKVVQHLEQQYGLVL